MFAEAIAADLGIFAVALGGGASVIEFPHKLGT
jgi:hypothetical protein